MAKKRSMANGRNRFAVKTFLSLIAAFMMYLVFLISTITQKLAWEEPSASSAAVATAKDDKYKLQNDKGIEDLLDVEEKSKRGETEEHFTKLSFKKRADTFPEKIVATEDEQLSKLVPKKWSSDNVAPIYHCKEPNYKEGREIRLVFVHIFKTAGSSIRKFFGEYSQRCNTSFDVAISCTGISSASIREGNWKPDTSNSCKLKRSLSRSGKWTSYQIKTPVSTTYLERNTDILGGHLPLGSWEASSDNPNKVRYLSFFRDPAAKYVSGKMYIHKGTTRKWTIDDWVEYIKKDVTSNLAEGNYSGSMFKYLITPFQDEEYQKRGEKLTKKKKTELAMKNLVEYNLIIGIVERMSESMEILQNIIDSSGDATDIFHKYGMKEKNGKSTEESVVFNNSIISTSSVLNELKKDAEFFPKLLEFVRYEQQIYEFALKLHMQQYDAIQ